MSQKQNSHIKYLKLFSFLGGVFILAFAFTARAAVFNRNLSQGSIGSDVLTLQHYLNSHNFPIASSGSGSLGKETTKFGSLTKQALIRFQEFYAAQILTPLGLKIGTGRFSDSTRKFVNAQLDIIVTSTPPVLNYSPVPSARATTSPFIYSGNYASGGGANPNVLISSSVAPAISFANFTKTYGDSSFIPSVTSNSPGSFTFTSSSSTVATASGNTVTIVGTGTTTITTTQSAAGNYTSGSASAILTVNKKVPNLVWRNSNLPMITVAEEQAGGSPFPLPFTTSPTSDSPGTFFLYSGNPILFSVNPSSGQVSALQDLNPNITPNYTITVGQNATANFTSATTTATVTPTDPNDCSPNPCQNGGTCSAPGDGYSFGGFACSCPDGYGGLTCQTVQTPPSINFPDITLTDASSTFTPSLTSSSTAPFTFTSSDETVATVGDDGTVTLVGLGMAVISATQPPEGIYSTGTASATLTVNSSECMENPCQNYGICVEEFRDYVCVCQPGFTGPNCQNIILIGGGDAGQAYNYDPNNVLACFVGAGRGSMISYSPALPPKKIL